jgi:7-cyano-7-deazaguanine synthase
MQTINFGASTMKKAFVLLSGGMDSTTCLYQAIYDYVPQNIPLYGDKALVAELIDTLHSQGGCSTGDCIGWVEAISVDYGQRHKKEFDYAAKTCALLGIKHTVLNLQGILDGKGVMLTDASVAVPNISYNDINGVSPTYVPFRNGTLLSLITAYAQKWVNEQNEQIKKNVESGSAIKDAEQVSAGIYFGAHSEDAHNWAYPDCTPEFIGAMANAIYIGSYMQIRLHTPLQWMQKSDVVRLGDRLEVPFQNTWSCYKGEMFHCGVCPTCRSRREAFTAVGIPDPTKYADPQNEAAE